MNLPDLPDWLVTVMTVASIVLVCIGLYTVGTWLP